MFENLTEVEFEEKLNFYRENYFLDPQGSNTEKFVKIVNNTLNELLKTYTGKDFNVQVELTRSKDVSEVRVKDDSTKKDILNKIADKADLYSMPKESTSLDECVTQLTSMLQHELRFTNKNMGQMHPHDNIISYVAGIAGKFVNGNTIAEEVSRVTTHLEHQAIGWLANEFGYNPNKSLVTHVDEADLKPNLKKLIDGVVYSSGNITTGGTTANLTALLVARNKAFRGDEEKCIKGAAEEGFNNKDGAVVFGSEYAHYSIEKLCGYIGLGSDSFKKVNSKNIQIDPNKLRKQMYEAGNIKKKIIAVVSTVGTTETGTIDDLEAIAEIIDDFEKDFGYRPHFHVDAAHSGGFVFHDKYSPKKNGLFKGINRADSITVDSHKMLYTHYNAGTILFKNSDDHDLLKVSADYLFKKGENGNLGDKRVEGSMGLEGALQTWHSLNALGQEGYQVIQEHILRLTSYLTSKINNEKDFEVMHDVQSNLICFRYNDGSFSDKVLDVINKEAQKEMYKKGIAYISNDRLQKTGNNPKKTKVDVFRTVIMHPYTTKEDVDFAFDEVKSCINDVIASRYKHRVA